MTSAIIAVCGLGVSAVVTWLLGRRTARAAERSSKAARQAVTVSKKTARATGRRAKADARSRQYHDAAAQMGDTQPHVRVAGVYAMTRLADDWPEQRQACIDVLCAYLRVPINGVTTAGLGGETEVRRTIVRQIAAHVHRDTEYESWSDSRFDLSNTVISDLVLYNAVFNATVNFENSELRGINEIVGVHVGKSMSFDRCTVNGTLRLARASVEGVLTLNHMNVPAGSTLSLAFRSVAVHPSPTVSVARLHLGGKLIFTVMPSVAAQGLIGMRKLKAVGGSTLRIVPIPPINPDAALLPTFTAKGWQIVVGVNSRLSPKLFPRDAAPSPRPTVAP